MDPRSLYSLRYRRGSTGVVISFVSASSFELAEETGKWWCNANQVRFIKVEAAIVADEAQLPNLAELKAEHAAKAERLKASKAKEEAAIRRINTTPPLPDAKGKAAAAAAGR